MDLKNLLEERLGSSMEKLPATCFDKLCGIGFHETFLKMLLLKLKGHGSGHCLGVYRQG